MSREEFAAKFPGVAYPFDDDEQNNGAESSQKWKAQHRLGGGFKVRLGKNIEVYQSRAPKVRGKLVDYDDRYGRITVKTEEGEVDLMLGYVIQVRWLPD